MLAIAIAGPAASVPVSHASGTVILAMDVSGSMAATDVVPSRLAAAQRAALSFISAQPDSVDIGVVAFQQGGLEAALPTADHATPSAAVRGWDRRRHVTRRRHPGLVVRDLPREDGEPASETRGKVKVLPASGSAARAMAWNAGGRISAATQAHAAPIEYTIVGRME